MQLPDFLEFEPFNRQRELMGAHALGDFVFFDPAKNLTGEERMRLARGELVLDKRYLWLGEDNSLAYKDSRLYVLEARLQQGDTLLHLADCDVVSAWMNNHKDETASLPLQGSTSTAPDVEVAQEKGKPKVCSDCLQRLRYQGFDRLRPRHVRYSEQVQANFSLHEYFQHYPQYPVKPTRPSVFF